MVREQDSARNHVSSRLAKFQHQSSKNVTALGELKYRQFSEFLEVLWDSNAHFSGYKAVIWQLYVVYA